MTPQTPFQKALDVLRRGGVIVFPTETSYGIGCDATNRAAVRRVLEIKGRDQGKTPPLIVASVKMAEAYADMTPMLRKLAHKHWPGALTIVSPLYKGGLRGVIGLSGLVVRDQTIALRVSSHPTARKLSAALGAPLVATSANHAGEPSCFSVRAVRRQFGVPGTPPYPPLEKGGRNADQPDFYLDEGCLPRRRPSTIVKEEKGKIVVLRNGAVIASEGRARAKQSSRPRRLLRRPAASSQ